MDPAEAYAMFVRVQRCLRLYTVLYNAYMVRVDGKNSYSNK